MRPSIDGDVLARALQTLLACPLCGRELTGTSSGARCPACGREYPLRDGVLYCLVDDTVPQEDERRARDVFACQIGSGEDLLRVVGRHHCIPVMRARAEAFHARFAGRDWIVDLGVGYGWHWQEVRGGAGIVGVDFSRPSLGLAHHLLRASEARVLLVCADAARLPFRRGAVAGLWSVQVFQHFPASVLQAVKEELDRVLAPAFAMEIYNLNPAPVLRAIYRLCGRRLPRKGRSGPMEVNRRTAREWIELWRAFRGGRTRIVPGYSELFFHPDLRLVPSCYPARAEERLAERFTGPSSWIARQVQLRIEAPVGLRDAPRPAGAGGA